MPREIPRAHRVAEQVLLPVLVNLDAFKAVNDRLGQVASKLAGDKLSEKINEKLGDKVSPELKNALKGLFKR